MRENTGIILWILVISFGGIWVLQDSGAFDVAGFVGDKIIIVDGDPVTVDEYNNTLDFFVEQFRQQTGESMPPQRLDLEHDRVFNTLVDDKLREHEMDRLGITVTDQEVLDLVYGDEPHPIISVYFGDGQGGVDRALLQSFRDDPAMAQQRVELATYLRTQRRQQKLDNLIAATVRVSDQDVENEHRRQYIQASASFFALRFADVPNDSVEVSERDLRRFYNENRDDFKRKRSFTIKVASIPKQPSRADTLNTTTRIEDLRPTFEETDNDSLFLVRNASERPYSSAFFSAADLDADIANAVFEAPEKGKIIGPFISTDARGNTDVHLIKILELRPPEETAVRARHILFRATQGVEGQRANARREAEEYKQRILNGEDFATLARQRSDDTSNKDKGGDLGWFGPDRMVEPFEDAAFSAPVGRVVGPVETQYGFHLIEVIARANHEVRIADYAERLRPSSATLISIEDRLDDVKYYAEEKGSDFVGEAERTNLELQDIQVEQDQQFIPSIGNSRRVTRFLEEAEEGDISDVIELDNLFLVAYLETITPEGYRPFEEVEAEIRPRALLEKKKVIQRERMDRAYQEHGFDGLAQALGISARTATNISFTNHSVPTLGRDALLAGRILGLAEGEETGVFEGENAVIVAKVTNVIEPAPLSDLERNRIREQLLTSRKSTVQSQWVASLREKADIEDFRNRILQ
ncbi:MAG: peptidylprolyl isomerase [Rhodothermales bacterium]